MLENEIKSSPIEEIHSLNDAKFVNFAGWSMPIQFPDGIINEHISTRSSCGLFDISHMGQILIDGDESRLLLEKITPTDIGKIQTGKVKYSFLLNNEGGIIDDLMITNEGNCFYLVVNASRINEDLEEINKASKSFSRINIKHLQQNGMIALQGPKAKDVVSSFFREIDDSFFFMSFKKITLNGDEVRVSRIGYTGEDGFEISSTKKTILELTFAISPSRIKDGNFRGADKILNEIENGSQFVRVGLLPEGRRPVRKGTPIFNNDEKIGEISSGGYGPTIKSPIAMGIIKSEFNKPNNKLTAKLGENSIPMTITSLPFVEHRYFKKGNKQ